MGIALDLTQTKPDYKLMNLIYNLQPTCFFTDILSIPLTETIDMNISALLSYHKYS